MLLKCVADGGVGAGPPAAGGFGGSGGLAPSRYASFCNFLEKKSYFNAIVLHFARVQSHLKALDF